jgi:putative membrane protein insertion efficiency factor
VSDAPRPGLAARFCIAGVRGYQIVLGPLLGGQCRFTPSCSFYAIDAFTTHGAWRGMRLTLRRLLRCHPWGGSGPDPVPPRGGCCG